MTKKELILQLLEHEVVSYGYTMTTDSYVCLDIKTFVDAETLDAIHEWTKAKVPMFRAARQKANEQLELQEKIRDQIKGEQ